MARYSDLVNVDSLISDRHGRIARLAHRIVGTPQGDRMIEKAETEGVLARLLGHGVIDHVPKKPADMEVLMALVASQFDPGQAYTEQQANALLEDWLAGFADPHVFDHVTVRRYLVDLGFLERDPSGTSYRTNESAIASVLAPDARTVDPVAILAEVQRQREERRRRYTS